jgi:outer membrane biosynthesis protein TonB
MGFKLKSGNKPKMSGGLLAQCEPMDNLTIAVVETTPMNKGFRSNEQAQRLLEKGKFDKYQKKLSQDLGGGMEGAASPLKEDDDEKEERDEEVGGTTPSEPDPPAEPDPAEPVEPDPAEEEEDDQPAEDLPKEEKIEERRTPEVPEEKVAEEQEVAPPPEQKTVEQKQTDTASTEVAPVVKSESEMQEEAFRKQQEDEVARTVATDSLNIAKEKVKGDIQQGAIEKGVKEASKKLGGKTAAKVAAKVALKGAARLVPGVGQIMMARDMYKLGKYAYQNRDKLAGWTARQKSNLTNRMKEWMG